MVSNLKCEEEFVVDMPVSADSPVRIVRRVTDGQLYLVRDQSTAMAHDEIIAFETAARVLNHENLISVVKPNVAPANGSTDSDFSLVYEYCADGNLKQLFDKPHVEATHQGFLPEGLIWHVALSMLRALIFLHEGRRERVIMCKEDDKLVREWYCLDNDWMPILHRAIRPENIHFQAARGEETYGLCKLGNFGRCVVAGTARVEKEDNHLEVVAVLNDLVDRDVPQEQIRGMWELARDNAGTANRENMRHVSDHLQSVVLDPIPILTG
jgi:serine/threonine protein kinase